MPEYLAPGVYVEETSFRAKSIEGVSTSTAGFIGPARYGPISGQPELLTSFADFQRIYGGLEDIGTEVNYLAHAVRAFFEEGGRRCYVVRVFKRLTETDPLSGHGKWNVNAGGAVPDGLNIVARFPGKMGNVRVTFSLRIGRNIRTPDPEDPDNHQKDNLNRVQPGDVVYLETLPPANNNPRPYKFESANLRTVGWDAQNEQWTLQNSGNPAALQGTTEVHPVTMTVEIQYPTPDGGFSSPAPLGEFTLSENDEMGLLKMLALQPSTPYADLTMPIMIVSMDNQSVDTDVTLNLRDVVTQLTENPDPFALNQPFKLSTKTLSRGNNGDNVNVAQTHYEGVAASPRPNEGFQDLIRTDEFTRDKNGLRAFEAVPNISIVAAPAAAAIKDADQRLAVNKAVITHCAEMKYRVAVLDISENQTVSSALDERNKLSSKYAAIYYPWIYVSDPRPGKGGQRLKLPPSGFVAGIYARNDTERAVFKAPANEVVRLAVDFEQRLSKAHQEVLNPEGVNCFRFFEGRGFLLWGARTISPDPEFKYVSVRRYFAYLEYSIERGTQWAVFENNDEPLWANIRRTIEDFLFTEWKRGGLMGEKPEKAFFVRCDRSTMTQNDLDNGRLICLIGVAPVKPAEFVIFRIGQWTADSPMNMR
jgi:phage tail sheath protein FI